MEVEESGDSSEVGVESLELLSIFGFEGVIHGGLICHPDGQHLIYSLGCKVIIKDMATSRQTFLSGHSSSISSLACSESGTFLASGQQTYMGFKADIIVWSFSERCMYAKFTLHKVKVQAVAFSPNDKYLASLGGQDDNTLVVWDLETREPVCGCAAAMTSAGMVHALAFSKTRDDIILTGGDGTLRVWELNPKIRKVIASDCNLGQLKRVVKCIEVAEDSEFMYCGTTTGDVLQVSITTTLIKEFGPPKSKFVQGVSCIRALPSGKFLLGTGEGLVLETTGTPKFKKIRSVKLPGRVTSISLREGENQFFVGLGSSQMYRVNYTSFECSQLSSCHGKAITSVVFPKDSSELFATSSTNDVRVWHTHSGKELLRVSIPNLTCNAVIITPDGKAIVSGWDDGKIRAFYPESGKNMYTIENAHNKGVTALACTSTNRRLVSGGGEGQVRVWDVTRKGTTSIKETLKEHKGAITCIKITQSDEECVTSSTDGTCIIWDLVRFVRSQIIFANTMFRVVCYRPDECQIITTGTDRKIGYWETYDGAEIRELDGSKTHSINGMDIYDRQFVTGGGDKLVKVWRYNEGDVTHVGVGHSGEITGIKISPDGQYIISVSDDGAIMCWRYPALPHSPTPHGEGGMASVPPLDITPRENGVETVTPVQSRKGVESTMEMETPNSNLLGQEVAGTPASLKQEGYTPTPTPKQGVLSPGHEVVPMEVGGVGSKQEE